MNFVEILPKLLDLPGLGRKKVAKRAKEVKLSILVTLVSCEMGNDRTTNVFSKTSSRQSSHLWASERIDFNSFQMMMTLYDIIDIASLYDK